jgi:tetratricopeptide (TPR) repeat protein
MPSLEKVDQLYARAYPDMADKLSAHFRIDYYRMAGDQEKYLQATADYLETYSSEDAMELNNAAWNFFELVDDPDHLKLALGWARKSVNLEPGYYNYDTLAALYFKLGEKRKALKTAKQAISIAKAEGENYAATEALLEAIKNK